MATARSDRPPRAWTPERCVVAIAMTMLAALSWFYLYRVPMPMPENNAISGQFAVLTFVMWLVMMVAMMSPAVLPVVLLFQRVAQRSTSPQMRILLFVSGYFLAWGLYSLAATAAQLLLLKVNWIDAMGVAHHTLSAAFLAIIGIYQWSSLKASCLHHCRSPVEFITRYFRPGVLSASRMGFHHGLYCIGCCWLLMLLLFVGGVMNLVWVTGITLLVVLEKQFTQRLVQQTIGAVLLLAAAITLLR